MNIKEKEYPVYTLSADDTYMGDPDDESDNDDDWDDEEDESFDDMADDREDLHDIIVEEDIYDEDDDDHLPEEDI